MTLRHVMILASAGSGKTYALTNRFVQLLASGAPPERIVALTFTRKAAGEFFDEILHKLAHAARDPAYARTLGRDVGLPQLGPPEYLVLLRRVIDAMHRLKLGTLDSFFSRIARAFPLELGLAGEFDILQEHAARMERQRVLQRIFARTGGRLDAAQAEFIEAFKRATFGTEEKRLGARLDAFLDEHQEDFLAAPEPAMWGDPQRIWPGGSPWLGADVKLSEAISELRAALGPLTDGQRTRWENFFASLAEWAPGAPLAGPVEYILGNTLTAWRELCDGCAEITIDRRKLPLPKPACRALEKIIRHLIGAELQRHIETTRGIHAVLRGYENHYHEAVRRMGRLTFADVQRLLAPDSGAPLLSAGNANDADAIALPGAADEESSGQLLLLKPGGMDLETPAERRLSLDYRLDAEIDHWLLDEFQDTSHGQWSVLRNLIDEVVQDPEHRRSFFCVGDVKQAIYAWREGDPRLFREIFNHYNANAPGAIEERHLTASHRSGPALITMVNAVFGSAPTLTDLFPGEASVTWNREWRDHESAVPDRNGQAALLHAADEFGRWTITRQLLEEIRPLDRGLSCAVLVKKNDVAAALADFLRRANIPAIAEADLRIATDNPLGAALLALVQAAAHPGDMLAQEHVRMTPLSAILSAEGVATPEALTTRVLGQIHAGGFERTIEHWVERLEPHLAPEDAFSRRRASEFVAAAGLFDATGSRNSDEFVAFMERHAIRAPESTSVVRVMTIHKAKGLGFDVVVLPDLQGKRIDEPRAGLAVRKAPDRSVQWVLDLPPRLYCEQDEVLAEFLRAAEADACYENLSLLYVAMTRAKRAMYVITEPVGKSKSRNFPKLLAETLGDTAIDVKVGAATFTGAWATGDSRWHEAILPPPATTTPKPRLEPVTDGVAAPARLAARRPSGRRDGSVSLVALFALETGRATEFGSALHALLAEVIWVAPGDAARWAEAWRRARHPVEVVEAATRTLAAPTLAQIWAEPRPARSEVWRERSFEIVLGGEWVTGIFDRVVVTRDAHGRIDSAVVYDFKTDRVQTDPEITAAIARHAEQMNLYRRVAAVLTGLPAGSVRCELVFTQPVCSRTV